MSNIGMLPPVFYLKNCWTRYYWLLLANPAARTKNKNKPQKNIIVRDNHSLNNDTVANDSVMISELWTGKDADEVVA
jgi:hypothetical protein